jgi:hypothetical protein
VRYDRIVLLEGRDVMVSIEDDLFEGTTDMVFGVNGAAQIYVVFVDELGEEYVLGPREVHLG